MIKIEPNYKVGGTAGINTQNTCGNIDISGIVGLNYSGTKGEQTDPCPNDMLAGTEIQSTWYQTFDWWKVDANGWYAYTCYNYRASTDNKSWVEGVEVGNTISFRAGFKIYANTQASTTTPLAYGNNSALLKYTIMDDAATALLASITVTAAAVISLGF